MGAVFRKEFKTYFTTPIGYIQIGLMAFFGGLLFSLNNIFSGSPDMTAVFSNMFMISMLILPIITMRLFSEEKRQKTDQLLFTSPVSLTGIVLGKFFAAFLMFATSLIIFLVFALLIAFQVTPEWTVIVGNLVGLLLIGGLIISIGIFISSLTESQLIAALGTWAVVFFLMFVDLLAVMLPQLEGVSKALDFISITQRYTPFVSGMLRYDNIIFFVSMQALFLFLTVRVLDKKRWS